MLTRLKAGCVQFRVCSFWSRREKSLSRLVSSILEKRGENASRPEWRGSVLKLLFGCLCPVSASRLSSTLPCQSLISLCFKTCLLPTCLRLLCRCQFICLFRPPVATGSISFLRHVRERHAADTDTWSLTTCTCCPSTHRPAKLYTPPSAQLIFEFSNTRYI